MKIELFSIYMHLLQMSAFTVHMIGTKQDDLGGRQSNLPSVT